MIITSDRPLYWPDFIYKLQTLFADSEIYLVGGVVRDVYLRFPIHDIDLIAPTDGRPFARQIANAFDGDYYPLDTTRGVGRAIITWQHQQLIIDVAQFRIPDLIADLRDRDFTVNALAVALNDLEHLFDPCNGLTDMKDRIVRLCQPNAIANDPVRALRAIRLSLAFQMRLWPDTVKAIRSHGKNLTQTSPERIRDEFFKLLGGSRPMAAINLLDTLGLLAFIIPETSAMKGVKQSPPHIFDVWRHTLSVVDYLDHVLAIIEGKQLDENAANFALGMFNFTILHLRPDLRAHLNHEWPNGRSHRALLILAALAHDIAKPLTQSVGEDGRIHFYRHEDKGAEIAETWQETLALSNEETERLRAIVRHHMRPMFLDQSHTEITRRVVYRFWRDAGVAGIDVCLLTIADYLGKIGPKLEQTKWLAYVQLVRTLLDGYFQQHEELVTFKPLIDGNQIMQYFNLKPGPIIGEILAALREAQAMQEIQTADESLTWATQWLKEHLD